MSSVYLEPLHPEQAETAPANRLLPLFEKVQLSLLWCFVLFVVLLPTNALQLAAMVMLGFVWAGASLVGVWAIIKRPQHRALGVRLIAAYPVTIALIFVLTQLGFPFTDYRTGSFLLWAGIAAIPAYIGARWIKRSTDTKAQPVATTRTMSLTLLVTLPIAALSVLLLLILVTGSDGGVGQVLGRSWYEKTLMATIVVSIVVGLFAVPYSLVGLIRSSGRRAGMATILAAVLVAALCQSAIIGLIAIGQVG